MRGKVDHMVQKKDSGNRFTKDFFKSVRLNQWAHKKVGGQHLKIRLHYLVIFADFRLFNLIGKSFLVVIKQVGLIGCG